MHRPLRDYVSRALVVEDDRALGVALARALRCHGLGVRLARSLREARAYLAAPEGSPELVVLDVALPDGTAVDLLGELCGASPRPVVVAISGAASAGQSFELARLGVRRFVQKPLDLAELERALEEALREPADLDAPLRTLVGKRPIHEVESQVRQTMVDEAMARAGSVRGAARLLAISRQLLQHMLRRSA